MKLNKPAKPLPMQCCPQCSVHLGSHPVGASHFSFSQSPWRPPANATSSLSTGEPWQTCFHPGTNSCLQLCPGMWCWEFFNIFGSALNKRKYFRELGNCHPHPCLHVLIKKISENTPSLKITQVQLSDQYPVITGAFLYLPFSHCSFLCQPHCALEIPHASKPKTPPNTPQASSSSPALKPAKPRCSTLSRWGEEVQTGLFKALSR